MENEKLGFVKASKYRKEIISLLKESKKTPKEISKECETSLSHVSGLLKEMREEDLVESLTPNMNKGKLYGLTEQGEEIANRI